MTEGLRVCILARKDLGPFTRIPRQAQALVDAGHDVTVVSLGRPSEESRALTPDVEYVEVTLDHWTRRRLASMREQHKDKQGRLIRRDRADAKRGGLRARVVPLRRSLRARGRRIPSVALAVPSGLLLRTPDEPALQRMRAFARMDPIRVLGSYTNVAAQPIASREFATKVCEAVDGRRFDVVQAHDNYALVAARRLARRHGAKLVFDAVEISEHRISVRRTPFNRLIDAHQRRQEARIFRSAEAVIAVGDGVAEWYARRFGIARPVTVRNCRWYWPHERRSEIRAACGVGDEERLVVWFGYAYPAQGIETMIEAAAHTTAHFALLTAVLPKWTQFRADLERRIEALDVGDRVHLLPPHEANTLVPYVSGADLGIIPRPNVGPNVYYSMPNKFMEMVMARLPVAISSDLADIRILTERLGVGRAFDVTDPVDVARTLDAMLEPEAYARLRENVMAAAEELCWERESRRYVEVFTNSASTAPE